MAFLEKLGVPSGFLGSFSGGLFGKSFLFWIGFGIIALAILIFAGGITIYFTLRKNKRLSFKNQIPIFMNINGKLKRVAVDQARELFIPDSNISLFFLKNNRTYLPRPTRAMGNNEYWHSISENGEWVNFDLSISPESNTLAEANYDHRDTRYAFVNLREIIKRNYKDKSQMWWKDPVIMNIIAFVIMCFVFGGFCWFLIAKMGVLMGEMGHLIEKFEPISQTLGDAVKNAQNINSGVVGA